jgi:hypothetical protein
LNGVLNLNSKQRNILVVGIVLFILAGVVPPWKYTNKLKGGYSEKPAGYSLIFLPPSPEEEDFRFGVKIDWGRLAIQWTVLVVGIGFCTLIFNKGLPDAQL